MGGSAILPKTEVDFHMENHLYIKVTQQRVNYMEQFLIGNLKKPLIFNKIRNNLVATLMAKEHLLLKELGF